MCDAWGSLGLSYDRTRYEDDTRLLLSLARIHELLKDSDNSIKHYKRVRQGRSMQLETMFEHMTIHTFHLSVVCECRCWCWTRPTWRPSPAWPHSTSTPTRSVLSSTSHSTVSPREGVLVDTRPRRD